MKDIGGFETVNYGYIVLKLSNNKHHVIGTLSEELDLNTMNITYAFNIDKKAYLELNLLGFKDVENQDVVPGLDIDLGYKQRHKRVPFIVFSRTPDPRRTDMSDILREHNLEHYNQFDFLLKIKGVGFDDWEVRDSLEGLDLDNPDYLERR